MPCVGVVMMGVS